MPLESQIQTAVLNALRALGHWSWRVNTMGVPIHGAGGTIAGWRPGPQRGISDIIGMRKGDARFIAVEVKRPGKKPTPEQQRFLDDVRERGGIAIVATSVDDILDHPELVTKSRL